MTDSVRLQCNVSQAVKDKFNSYLNKNRSSEQLLSDMLQVYEIKKVETEKLQKVCDITNLSEKQVLEEALRSYIKKILNSSKKNLVGHKKSMPADQHMAEVVNSIIEDNDKAQDKNDTIYINQTSITKWLRDNDKKLINFNVIQRYLRLHTDLLKEHHNKHGLDSSHNKKAFISKRQQQYLLKKQQEA